MGFEEVAHTADWALRVWADDLAGLFAEAARGMYALAGAQQDTGPKEKRTFAAEAQDAESLLVAFLSELVYAAEQEKTMFTGFQVRTLEGADGWRLEVEMEGAPIVSINKTIKAVTYHNLQIQPTTRGYEVEIVFDV
jgi:SHS2 domain-containing protein